MTPDIIFDLNDRVLNFRDAATLNPKLKKGKIFRSSSLTRYQNEAFFPDLIQAYSITKVIDLRDEDEYTENPYTDEAKSLFTHLLMSIDPRKQSVNFIKNFHYGTNHEIAYRHYAVEHQHIFRRFFEEVNPETDIILVHCHAGKDRTGALVALVALLLGESMDNILKDYLKSEADTEPQKLQSFLEIVRRAGGAAEYLQNCGVNETCINHWIKHLSS